jgi:hypothetical protein
MRTSSHAALEKSRVSAYARARFSFSPQRFAGLVARASKAQQFHFS